MSVQSAHLPVFRHGKRHRPVHFQGLFQQADHLAVDQQVLITAGGGLEITLLIQQHQGAVAEIPGILLLVAPHKKVLGKGVCQPGLDNPLKLPDAEAPDMGHHDPRLLLGQVIVRGPAHQLALARPHPGHNGVEQLLKPAVEILPAHALEIPVRVKPGGVLYRKLQAPPGREQFQKIDDGRMKSRPRNIGLAVPHQLLSLPGHPQKSLRAQLVDHISGNHVAVIPQLLCQPFREPCGLLPVPGLCARQAHLRFHRK